MAFVIDIGTEERISVPKIICVGRNYAAHAEEMGTEVRSEPLLFFKPPTAVLHQGCPIPYPAYTSNLHHEVELGIVMAKGNKEIPLEEVRNHVYGYLLALDLTLRDKQDEAKKEGWPWAICKGFDGSLPVSMVVRTNDLKAIQSMDIKLWVNEQLRQSANTDQMIFSIEELITYISRFFTLERGDIILTGTPEGVAPIHPGDMIEAELGSRLKIRFLVR
jgi:2-keto-4-pentenoate hydratase/2-oxohepta-3-ene-1,7-dioic acid hydratase in catechol pathway